MPPRNSPEETLHEWQDVPDNEMTPQPLNLRCRMWLARRVMRVGKKYGREDRTSAIRMCLMAGVRELEKSPPGTLDADLQSASDNSSYAPITGTGVRPSAASAPPKGNTVTARQLAEQYPLELLVEAVQLSEPGYLCLAEDFLRAGLSRLVRRSMSDMAEAVKNLPLRELIPGG